MSEPDVNQILNDPALLVEYKDLVIDLYNQLIEERIEPTYQAMLVLHRTNSELVINTLEIFINKWIDLAQNLEKQQDADNLKVAREIFIGAVQLAAYTTYNINITHVKGSTIELSAVLSRLFQEAQSQPDIVNPIAQDINSANEAWTNASATYVSYWNTQFKDISDKWQIINMIRDAVIRASGSSFQDLVEQRESLLLEIGNFTEKYIELLEEWTQGLSNERRNEVYSELLSIWNTIKAKETDLKNVEDKLNSNQSDIKGLLRTFGLEAV